MLKPLTRRRRLAGLAAAGVAATLIAAGCGGSSDRLSSDEYRDQADAICLATDEATENFDVTTSEGLLALIAAQREQIDELDDLDPPEELEDEHEEAVDVLNQLVDRFEVIQQRIADGENATTVLTAEAPQLEDLGNRADELAVELGLEVCGNDDESTSPDTTTDEPTTDDDVPVLTGGVAQYIQDLTAGAAALQSFGTALQSVDSPAELEDLAPGLSANLDAFDEALSNMGGYTLGVAQLDEQREALIATGPAVSDVLRRFVDAAADGDGAAIQELVPEIQSAIDAFSEAASGNATP